MRKYKLDKDKKSDLPKDEEIMRYKNFGKLVYNYQKATKPVYKKPLYKDPKTFIVLLIIVLLAWLLAEVVDKPEKQPATDPIEETS